MKNMNYKELMNRYMATEGALAHVSKSNKSQRRHQYEFDIQALGNPFIRDSSVLCCSKANRRMGRKNQVASSQHFTHVRDRGTHVDEVVAHAIRLADHLGLNVHLAHAIALGHDIGHVPFGHQGEHYLRERLGKPFTHEVMGVILAQHIERKGNGLNLTWHTLDGMWRHSGNNASPNMTQEAWIVRYADKIAYLFADYNDFNRFGWKCSEELAALMDWFGKNQRERTFRTMMTLCEESALNGKVVFEGCEAAVNFKRLRQLMYAEYSRIVEQDVSRYLDPLWNFFERTQCIPPWLGIALMTDVEVLRISQNSQLLSFRDIKETGLGEILDLIPREKLFSIDSCDLDLDWFNPYELERKFLFKGGHFHELVMTDLLLNNVVKSSEILQYYLEPLSEKPHVERRVRRKFDVSSGETTFFYTEKSNTPIIGAREENEKEITEEEFKDLLTQKRKGFSLILKNRHVLKTKDGYTLEIDVFLGGHHGLVLLECEFNNLDEMNNFKLPEFLGQFVDVTENKQYSNASLAEHGIPS